MMLRFGDERREVGYVLPIVLRSVNASDTAVFQWPPAPVAAIGESARPGAAPVVMWVEGDRNGHRTTTRTDCWRPRSATGPVSGRLVPPAVVKSIERYTPDGTTGTDDHDRADGALGAPAPFPRAPCSTPLLRLLCRQNE
jgi:hypothetical protein